MALGPGFSAEVQAGERNRPEVVLSHGYWMRALGGDRSVLNRPLLLNGVAFRVAGVTQPEFRGVNPGEPLPDLFVPILQAEALSVGYDAQLRRFQEDGSPSASRFLRLVARLEPGVDMDQAQAEATLLQRRWEAEFTYWAETVYGQTYQVGVRPQFYMAPGEIRQMRQALFFLWFVVGAVFLIGCTNLALLLLAQVSGREREMGIRASMGAARRRLFAQLTTESLVLSILGGAAGLGLAVAGTKAIPATLPGAFGGGFRIDPGVILFAFGLAALAAVLFGTLPAWRLSTVDVAALIQRPGQSRTRALLRGGLVVGQTALSILLLVGAGLLVQSAKNIQRVDLGFEPDQRWIFSTQLDNRGFSEEEGLAFLGNALDRLAQEPGIRWASVCNRVPFLGSSTFAFTAPGTDFADQGLQTGINLVGPDYFDATDITIRAGRAIGRDDNTGSPLVAVVNETFAARMWPEESALGKTLDFFDQSITVVGIAETVVYYNVREGPRRHVYLPSLQFYNGMQNFVVAAEPTMATVVPRIGDALRELDPNLTLTPMSLEELVDAQSSSFRTWTSLVGAFASAALFLALVGLYGVQSYLVSRRTREIGIRMAVGAERGAVVRSVVRWGLTMGGLGTLLGLIVALVASRFVRGFLFGVSPNDPVVFTAVPALLLAACLAASLVPALRASRINPVQALTEE
jgi:predicted permease